MNILVISREIPPVGGGAGYIALHLSATLAEHFGHTLHIVTMACGDLPETEIVKGMHIHRIRCGRRQRESSYLPEMCLFLARAIPFCRKIILNENIDLIHTHAILPDGLIGILAASGKVPTVATAHGTDVPGYNPGRFRVVHKLVRPVWLSVVKRMASVVAPSNHLASLIRAAYSGYDPNVIPYGIDDRIFDAKVFNNKTADFLIVSRLERRKNFHLFFEAIVDLDRPLRIHVVGEGEMLETLKQLAKRMPQHEILFHGWLANGEKGWQRLYEQSQFFVFPSLSENYPVSLMEASLAGMVILASDIPGSREVLGDTAVFYSPDSVSAIRGAVESVLRMDTSDVSLLGDRARNRVITQSGWRSVGQSYDQLYHRIRPSSSGIEK